MCQKNREEVMEIVSDSSSDDNYDSEAESSAEEAEPIEEEEEEDEVIKAIKREATRKTTQPPMIVLEDFVTDLSFHPDADILAISTIVGDVSLYHYSNEENSLKGTLELHTKACRGIEFNGDGTQLFSIGKDKSVMITDTNTLKLTGFYEHCHEAPIHTLTVIDAHLFATGDDDGTVKLFDTRQKHEIVKFKKHDDFISSLLTDNGHYLFCGGGDGVITTYDLTKRTIFMQSEQIDDEFTDLGLFRHGSKLVASTSHGKLYFYNWNQFGLQSDIFPGPKYAITSMIPVTETIAVVAGEDGKLRAIHLFPHRHLGVVGQHEMSIENVDINATGKLLASSGHDGEIKFWNVEYFEDFDKVNGKHKKCDTKMELARNLPSSQMRDVAEFFSDL